MTSLRILVVDSDEAWRRSLRAMVEGQPGWEICGETFDEAKAAGMAVRLTPDVVAMSASYRPETVESILRQAPDVGVVVFGSFDSNENVRGVLEAGAKGLLEKTDRNDVIHQGLESVSRGEPFLSPATADMVLEEFLVGKRPGNGHRKQAPRLTRRERELVGLLAEGKTIRAAARELGISVKTVENHRANAMRKLGARSVADMVRAAIRNGMIER